MSVDVAAVNARQEQRNLLFQDWITKLEAAIQKLAKTDEVVVELFGSSNPTYVGALRSLIGIPALGENKFYCTLYHYDLWGVKYSVDKVAKIIFDRIKEYNLPENK